MTPPDPSRMNGEPSVPPGDHHAATNGTATAEPPPRFAAAAGPSSARPAPPRRSGRAGFWLFLGVLIALGVVAALLWQRSREHQRLTTATEAMATPTVSVIRPQAGPTETEIVLPGNLMAFSEASIYARTSGYIKAWFTDLGTKVAEGQVLAEIEAPDMDAQLRQATAGLSQAKANLENARLNFERQKDLLQKKVASQAEFDQNRTSLEAMQAAVAAGEANVQNLSVMQGFQKIDAPFPGVVTRRNVDVGTLINAGTGSMANNAQELFHLARTDILRAFLNVPQAYSASVALDTPAYLELAEHPGQRFPGKVSHVSGAIDPATRTLLTEVTVSNADGRLFPGAFANVHLVLPLKQSPVVVPVNAMLFRKEGPQVGTVDDAGTVHLKTITIARDFGTTVAVASGLAANDRVIVNPSDSLADGAKVQVRESNAPARQAAGR